MASGYIGTGAADRDPAIGNDTVTSSKISDDAVTAAKINILDDALAATDAHIMVADGTDFGNVAISGDVTMTNAGVVTIANTSVENAMMAVNSIDSDQYVDGSIDNAHLADDAVDSDELAASAVDIAHMSANSVDSDQYVDGSIDNAHLADNAVGLAEMAGLVRGKIIVGNATGDPSALAMGTSEQVLRVNTAGTDLEYADAVGGAAWGLKTSAYTAVAGDGVLVDTDSSAITITLPISSGPPSLGDFIRILDATGSAATNNITVARNGNNIQGAAADLTIATNRAAIGLVYVNATEGWVLIVN